MRKKNHIHLQTLKFGRHFKAKNFDVVNQLVDNHKTEANIIKNKETIARSKRFTYITQ